MRYALIIFLLLPLGAMAETLGVGTEQTSVSKVQFRPDSALPILLPPTGGGSIVRSQFPQPLIQLGTKCAYLLRQPNGRVAMYTCNLPSVFPVGQRCNPAKQCLDRTKLRGVATGEVSR